MLTAHQITTMTESEMDSFLKTILVRYLEKKHGIFDTNLLNEILNFALEERLIENQDNGQKNLALNRIYPALFPIPAE